MRMGIRAAATAAATRHGASLSTATSYRARRTASTLRKKGCTGGRACRGGTAQNGSAAMTSLTCGISRAMGAVYSLHQTSIVAFGKRCVQRRRECRREHQVAEVVERDEQDALTSRDLARLIAREPCVARRDSGSCAP